MEQPIEIRYRWTADELLQAQRFHFRHTCRPVFRAALNGIACLAILGGVLTLFPLGTAEEAKPIQGIGCVLAGLYWLLVRPWERRWWTRRQFRKRPDRDTEIHWVASDDRVSVSSEVGTSELRWPGFSKAVFTQEGVLLYPIDQMFHWVPRHGFESDTEFDRFTALTRAKVTRHFEVC